jgi:Ni/Co efflux regulator RcnB
MLKYVAAAAVAFAMLTAPMAPSAHAEDAKKKEQSEAQKTAAEHRKQCSKEWADAKAAKKVEKGMTWPKFNGECMKRLSKA